jgi:hypothetical protein
MHAAQRVGSMGTKPKRLDNAEFLLLESLFVSFNQPVPSAEC